MYSSTIMCKSYYLRDNMHFGTIVVISLAHTGLIYVNMDKKQVVKTS